MNDLPNQKTSAKELKSQINTLSFSPLPGLGSPHAQTVLACFSPGGMPPPSTSLVIPLDDGDSLCCEVSTPPSWQENEKTIILLHGLGGCHTSSYMVRFSRILYQLGYRALRINMRGCGSGRDFAKLPYHGGLTQDVISLLNYLKSDQPQSPIILIGYSLGGNIALKLAGELGAVESNLLETTIAVCPPVDLAETAAIMCQPINHLYNRYYMRQLQVTGKRWTKGQSFSTIYEFDKIVTAPNWGFESPAEYYRLCSSRFFLSKIKHPCHILFAVDDPFINHRSCLDVPLSSYVNVWLSNYGGHMGFFGWTEDEHRYYWLDSLLCRWVKGDFEKT